MLSLFTKLTKLGIVTGLVPDSFDPNRPHISIKKPSGGLVYFNLIGNRIKINAATLNSTELQDVTEHLGSIPQSLSNGEQHLLDNTKLGDIIPWRGYWLQTHLRGDKVLYTCTSNPTQE